MFIRFARILSDFILCVAEIAKCRKSYSSKSNY